MEIYCHKLHARFSTRWETQVKNKGYIDLLYIIFLILSLTFSLCFSLYHDSSDKCEHLVEELFDFLALYARAKRNRY